MNNLRKYGHEPFRVAVIHGGPGAPGEMAPIAREISSDRGVLEPLQTASTLKGQTEELRSILENNGNPPLTMIGFSWGAWLSYIVAARYPSLVEKLILISSGPFEDKYAARITETRLNRLSGNEREEALSLLATLKSNTLDDNSFARFGELTDKADTYAPVSNNTDVLAYNPGIYQSVWDQANKMRGSGELLQLGAKIQCAVVAIHGDHDPHPAEGVRDPLTRVIRDFRFILLGKCGHRPWIESYAKDDFYRILKNEIRVK